MQTEIVIAGFGGQGVLFAGQILAYTAMDTGKEVTWIPSYGPEMRGGTANCTVIVSDEPIGSPLVRNPQAAIVLNLPSLDKYEPSIRPGGVLVVNTSLVSRKATRQGIEVVEVAANEIAESLGDKRLANMVLVGALLGRLPLFTIAEVAASLEAHLPARRKEMLGQNLEALQAGMRLSQETQATVFA